MRAQELFEKPEIFIMVNERLDNNGPAKDFPIVVLSNEGYVKFEDNIQYSGKTIVSDGKVYVKNESSRNITQFEWYSVKGEFVEKDDRYEFVIQNYGYKKITPDENPDLYRDLDNACVETDEQNGVEGQVEALNENTSTNTNEEKTDEDTTILDVIKNHKSICWYPSAGIDFRPLIIFNRSCYEAFEIPIDEEQTFPDLFILTDVNPPNYVWSCHSRPSPIENISCLNQEDKWKEITTLYEDKKTKITVNGSRRLKNLDIGCDRGELQSGYEVSKAYGNVLYFDVTVRSKRYESTEWDTWNANVLYVITENRTFAREVLMQNNIKIDYISVIRYGNSMGGGAAHSPDWLLGILGNLQCKYYVCNPQYTVIEPEEMGLLNGCTLTEFCRKGGEKWSNYGEVIWNRVNIS